MRNFFTKITVFFLILILASCNAVKRVNDGELLLVKNTILVNNEKETAPNIENLLYQQPNTTVFGIPVKLHIYNFAKEYPDTTFQTWLHKKPKRLKRLNRSLSEKQVTELQNYYSGINNWIKNTGEAPVIIDINKTKKALKRLKLYYDSQGYFNSLANYEIDTTAQKEKRAEINYKIQTGNAYFLDSITKNIASKDIDSIYELNKKVSLVKKGQQFNLLNFEAERERLSTIFSNSGIYKFQPTSIVFDIERDTIAANNDFKMPVEVQINNYLERINDSLKEIAYKVHKIKNVHIYADYDFSKGIDSLKTINYDNYTIHYSGKLRYKPKALTDAMAIIPGEIYRESDRTLTNQQVSNLRTFKYPNIDYSYEKNTADVLNAHIYLSPRPRFSLAFNTDVSHSNIQDIGVSFSTSLISRNIFRGTETLEIAARGTLGSSKEANDADDRFFNISEIGADVRLNFPRIFFPINTDKFIPKSMFPETRISIGTSVQKNIGLDKQSLNNILRYTWNPSKTKRNIFEMVNLEFIRNVNIDNFFNVYEDTYNQLNTIAQSVNYPSGDNLQIPLEADRFIVDVLNNNVPDISQGSQAFRDVRSIEERKIRLTDNNLIFASSFTHTKNNRQSFDDNDFSQFRIRLEAAGNFLSGVSNIINFKKNKQDKELIFGVPYSQYVKTELDYVKHWSVGQKQVLAFRSFLGFAIPYGNSDNIPFSESYFGGGSNDNRAWEAYSLGPGTTSNFNDFNEANLKLAFNLEYRYNLFGSLNGAFFADAGNIWNALDDVADERATFEGFSSLKEIALGTGFGLRYDFNFFILRLDIGFKTYNPANPDGSRWFREYNFGNAVYNIGINYPF
ncbi:BamA/TamA family outer membrane protein [Leptobacterium sp. I13]|uniref:translocation and assembly module lipoprotein TamL n=1 Tax=Leptobacterium meishanense TaxID=3128904 RepID=UPI0030EE4818